MSHAASKDPRRTTASEAATQPDRVSPIDEPAVPEGCPAHGSRTSDSRTRPDGVARVPDAPAVERRDDGSWVVRAYPLVRAVLRDADGTRQAGFGSERMVDTGLRRPVLFQDGADHREQRTAIARYFTPRTIDRAYRELMEAAADELVAELRSMGRARVDDLSLRLAVRVASRVVGLTNSDPEGLARRLEPLLELEDTDHPRRLRRWGAFLASQVHLFHFYLRDVRPAIRARRREPRDDVISHLLEQGYSPLEILIECVTYGAAGMATTREFISVAAWQLLERPALRARYLVADADERHAILHEVLRLEPVVGHLYRRTTRPLELEHEGRRWTIPAGAKVALALAGANVDGAAVGEAPVCLRPDRELGAGVQPGVVSFGDGAHRCPGAFLAIRESDAFLRRLLAEDLTVVRAPSIDWNGLIESYELRGFEVAVRAA